MPISQWLQRNIPLAHPQNVAVTSALFPQDPWSNNSTMSCSMKLLVRCTGVSKRNLGITWFWLQNVPIKNVMNRGMMDDVASSKRHARIKIIYSLEYMTWKELLLDLQSIKEMSFVLYNHVQCVNVCTLSYIYCLFLFTADIYFCPICCLHCVLFLIPIFCPCFFSISKTNR